MKNIKFKKISRKAKIAISLLSIGIFSFSAYSTVSAKNATNNKVYLVDIDDCDEKTKIYDENGNLINFQVEEGLLAIVDDYRTKPDKMYQTVIINNEGKMTSGYMDGKYLNDTFLDSIEHVSLSKSDISEVIAKDGLWLRKSNDISKYEDSFSYLENGKDVILSDMSFYSKNNSYDWKQGISVDVDSKKMQVGYLASDYVIDKDFENLDRKGSWDFVISQNNSTVDGTKTGHEKMFKFMVTDNKAVSHIRIHLYILAVYYAPVLCNNRCFCNI